MFWLALLLCCTATLALPLPDEVDSEESRKVLGSSVVTSVSVITDLGNGTQAIFADATGQQVQKPIVGGEVGSPVQMATPDHYQYYSFDGSGNLIKRYMTKDDVSSIIATNQKHNSEKLPDSPTFYHNMPANIGDLEFETTQDGEVPDNLEQAQLRVHSVVASVQNLLKSQMSSQAETHPEIPAHSTPDTSASWTMILPSFFGNHAVSDVTSDHSSTDEEVFPHNDTEFTNSTTTADIQQHAAEDKLPEILASGIVPDNSETHESSTIINNFTESVAVLDGDVNAQPSSESQVLANGPDASVEESPSSEKYEYIPLTTPTKDTKPVQSIAPQHFTQVYFKKKTGHPTKIPTVELPDDATTTEIYKETTVSTPVKSSESEQSTESQDISEKHPDRKPEFHEVPLLPVSAEDSHQPEKQPESVSVQPSTPSDTVSSVTFENKTVVSLASSQHSVTHQPDVEASSVLTHSEHEDSTQPPDIQNSEAVPNVKHEHEANTQSSEIHSSETVSNVKDEHEAITQSSEIHSSEIVSNVKHDHEASTQSSEIHSSETVSHVKHEHEASTQSSEIDSSGTVSNVNHEHDANPQSSEVHISETVSNVNHEHEANTQSSEIHISETVSNVNHEHEANTQSSEIHSSETLPNIQPSEIIEHVETFESTPVTERPAVDDFSEEHKVHHFSDESVMLGDAPIDSSSAQATSENSEEKLSSQSMWTTDQPDSSTEHVITSQEKDSSQITENDNSFEETNTPDFEHEEDNSFIHHHDDDGDDDGEYDGNEDENEHEHTATESAESSSSTEAHTTVASNEHVDKSEENKTPASSEELDVSKEQGSSESSKETISSDEQIHDSDSKIGLQDKKQPEINAKQPAVDLTTSEEKTSSAAEQDGIHSTEQTISGSEEQNSNHYTEVVQSDDPNLEDVQEEAQSHSTESYESFEKVPQSEESVSLTTVEEQASSTSAEGMSQNEKQTAYNSENKTSGQDAESTHSGNTTSEKVEDESQTDSQLATILEQKPQTDLANTLVLSEENHSSFNQIDTSSSKETSNINKTSSLAQQSQDVQKVGTSSPETSESSHSQDNPLPDSSNVNVNTEEQPDSSTDSNESNIGSMESSVSASPEKTTDTSSSTPEVTVESETTEVQDASNIKETFVASDDKNLANVGSNESPISETSENTSSLVIDTESTTRLTQKKQESFETEKSDFSNADHVNNENTSSASQSDNTKVSTEEQGFEVSTEHTQENAATEIVVTSVSTSKSTQTSAGKVTGSVENGKPDEEPGSYACSTDSSCSEKPVIPYSDGQDKTGESSESVEVTSKFDTQDSSEKYQTQSGLNNGYTNNDANFLTENPLIHTKPSVVNGENVGTLTPAFTEHTTLGTDLVTPASTAHESGDIIPISNEDDDDKKKSDIVSPGNITKVVTKKACDQEGSGNDSGTDECEDVFSGSGDGSGSEPDSIEETTEGSGDVETSSQEIEWSVTKPVPIGGKNTYKASDDDIPSSAEDMQDILKYASSLKDIGITKAPTLQESGELISGSFEKEDDSIAHNTDKRNDDVFFTTTAPTDAEFEVVKKPSSNETQENSEVIDIVEYGNSNSDIGITNSYNGSETESTEPNVEMTTIFDEDLMMNDGHLSDPTNDDGDEEGSDSMLLGHEQFLKDFIDPSSVETVHKERKPIPIKTHKVDVVKNVEANTKLTSSGSIPVTFKKKPIHSSQGVDTVPLDDPNWSKLDLVSPLENVPLKHKTTTVKPTSEKLLGEETTDHPSHHDNEHHDAPNVENIPQFYSPTSVELHPAPQESLGLEVSTLHLVEDVQQFAELCNELAFKLWVSMTEKGVTAARSLVMSPFAVTSLLAMIFLGAKGSTSGQMNDMLKLDDMMTFNPHQVFRNVTESVVQTRNQGVRTAAFVRELYSDKNKGPLLDFYKQRASQFYDGLVEEANFTNIGDILRRRTNLLIKKQTGGRVPEYLRGASLKLQAPLAAFSANIFQTECRGASTDGRDGEMYFTILPATRQRRLVPIPAAVFRNGFLAGYEPSLDATVVSLGMPDAAISTLFVLPGQQGQTAPGDGLSRLETRLIATAYSNRAWSRLLRSLLQRPGLEVQIPRFSHRSLLNVTHSLQHMGLNDLFNPIVADLKGLSGIKSALHVSDIVQVNTFTTCGEEVIGSRHHVEIYPSSPQRNSRQATMDEDDLESVPLVSRPRQARLDLSMEPSGFEEAVSQEGINKMPLALRPRQARLPDGDDSLPRLKFDRPFLYFVRHNPTGFILHMGRFNPRLLH